MTQERTECVRCGECCLKGGPALHAQDLPLLESGVLEPRHLVTLRAGELAWDQPKGELVPLDREMIKLKGVAGTWTCLFYVAESKGCLQYEHRPAECRALKCWDTSELEAMYNADRITRDDVFAPGSTAMELIRTHEDRCDYARIAELAADVEQSEEARRTLLESIRFDATYRDLIVEKAASLGQALDLLLGRPLEHTIRQFGYIVQNSASGLRLVQRKK